MSNQSLEQVIKRGGVKKTRKERLEDLDLKQRAKDEFSVEEVVKRGQLLLPNSGEVASPQNAESVLTAVLTPESRLRILGALVESGGEPLIASRICDIAGVSKASFARQKTDLLDAGIMDEVDKVGNARRFALNKDHPAAQLLWMLDRVLSFGETTMALDEEFVLED